MPHFFKSLFLLCLMCLSFTPALKAQETKPGMAFLKSLVLPGWGHFSLGEAHNSRGYVHLGSDIALVLSY